MRLSDARVTRLALTASGERLFARVWPSVWRVNERAMAGLHEPAVGLVRRALQQMCRKFDTSAFDTGAAGAASRRVAA